MFTWKNYAKQNANTVCRNAIMYFLWFGKDPAEFFNDVCDDPIQDYIPASVRKELADNAREIYMKASESVDGFLTVIEKEREDLISPFCKTSAEYIKKMLESDLTAEQIVAILPPI